jgi:hypothetical protein
MAEIIPSSRTEETLSLRLFKSLDTPLDLAHRAEDFRSDWQTQSSRPKISAELNDSTSQIVKIM